MVRWVLINYSRMLQVSQIKHANWAVGAFLTSTPPSRVNQLQFDSVFFNLTYPLRQTCHGRHLPCWKQCHRPLYRGLSAAFWRVRLLVYGLGFVPFQGPIWCRWCRSTRCQSNSDRSRSSRKMWGARKNPSFYSIDKIFDTLNKSNFSLSKLNTYIV